MWRGFKSWLQDNGHPTNYLKLTNAIVDIKKDIFAEKFNRLLTMADFIKILDLFKLYSEEDNGSITKFWRSYFEMISLMVTFIRATREEHGVEILQGMPAQTPAVIIDTIAMLQTARKIPERFSDLVVMIFKTILMQAGEARRVLDFVGDQYPYISIKNIERERRSNTGQLAVAITSSQQFCLRQWKK
ncbi:hypothetical protein ACROYT_G014908 [Oculina patagonica]